jgi:hypothetical protein
VNRQTEVRLRNKERERMKEMNYQNSKILKTNFIVNYKPAFINTLAVLFSEKVKFTLEQATKTQWGSRGIAILFS